MSTIRITGMDLQAAVELIQGDIVDKQFVGWHGSVQFTHTEGVKLLVEQDFNCQICPPQSHIISPSTRLANLNAILDAMNGSPQVHAATPTDEFRDETVDIVMEFTTRVEI